MRNFKIDKFIFLIYYFFEFKFEFEFEFLLHQDLCGICCGHYLMPFWTFFCATFLGKAVIRNTYQSIIYVTLCRYVLVKYSTIDLIQNATIQYYIIPHEISEYYTLLCYIIVKYSIVNYIIPNYTYTILHYTYTILY